MLAIVVPGQGWFYRWCLPAGSLSLGSLRPLIPFREALTQSLLTSQTLYLLILGVKISTYEAGRHKRSGPSRSISNEKNSTERENALHRGETWVCSCLSKQRVIPHHSVGWESRDKVPGRVQFLARVAPRMANSTLSLRSHDREDQCSPFVL